MKKSEIIKMIIESVLLDTELGAADRFECLLFLFDKYATEKQMEKLRELQGGESDD